MKLSRTALVIALLVASGADAQRTFGTLTVVESMPIPAGPSPLSAANAADWRFVEMVYAPLFSADANGGFMPYLGAKATTNADGTELTVSLHDDAKWSNGRSIQAADVVYTYTLAKAGKWNKAWTDTLRPVKEVRVADNGFDVVFTLRRKLPKPEKVLTVPLIPTGLHGDKSQYRPLPLGVIGAGSYKLAEDRVNSRLVINEHTLRKPKISEIRIQSVGSRELAVDVVRLMGDTVTFDVAPADAAIVGAEFGSRVIRTNQKRLIALAFHPKECLLGDATLRKAVPHLGYRPALFGAGSASITRASITRPVSSAATAGPARTIGSPGAGAPVMTEPGAPAGGLPNTQGSSPGPGIVHVASTCFFPAVATAWKFSSNVPHTYWSNPLTLSYSAR